MKFLIILATLAAANAQFQSIPTILQDGHIADTPEVAAAKNAFFTEYNRALAAASFQAAPAPIPFVSAPAPVFRTTGYNGPLANPTVLPNGFLADTPEVAAAKNYHYSELNRALSQSRQF